MSLLLCRMEPVRHPFEVPELGVRLYSSQELCYVIYENPLLALDDFIDERLIHFIREDLGMEFLAGRLENWKKSEENPDNMLLMLLTECSYYTAAEVNRYRQTLIQLRKKPPAELRKARADYLFEKKQYGKAIPMYEKLLELPRDGAVDDGFFSRIWCCLGACHARMFQFEKAFHAYDKAYFYDSKNEDILEWIYCLKAFCPTLPLSDRYRILLSGTSQGSWEKKIAAARQKGLESEEVKKIDRMFEQDSEKRLECAAELVKEWKQEYRSMM
ncbi:MAG: hypothetical protein Q4F29_02865 [Lachnospiraceae bacterium]|nr:hypothetical protein [Lachnospiraceae bacterium]